MDLIRFGFRAGVGGHVRERWWDEGRKEGRGTGLLGLLEKCSCRFWAGGRGRMQQAVSVSTLHSSSKDGCPPLYSIIQ